MKHGFIKVAAASPDIRVADCDYNAQSTIRMIRQAHEAQVQLVVLPELGLTGYTCADLFLQPTLLDGARAALAQVAAATTDMDIVAVCGLPVRHHGKLYNCAAVVQGGAILGLVPKTHLPNYGEFYEQRWFVPAPLGCDTWELNDHDLVPFGKNLLFCCEQQPEFVFAVEICEDLWAPTPPSCAHVAAGATIIVNPSASDETVGKRDYRRALVCGQSARLICGYIYAGAGEGESTTDMVFSGHSLIAENGALLAQNALFVGGLVMSEIDVQHLANERRRNSSFPAENDGDYFCVNFSLENKTTALTREIARNPFVPTTPDELDARCEEILQIQAQGLKKRLLHTGAKTLVLGISGGLDSTLALLAAARTIDLLDRPRADIVAVTMPCYGTTTRTKNNAALLCAHMNVTLREIDISAAVDRHFADIGHDPAVQDVTYENAQARERTQVLMDVANQVQGLVIGTGDLSELALGWATYNGDHMSMYGLNASIPKTLVRHLVAYEARRMAGELGAVLLDILDTPVSPELLPPREGEIGQKTEELVGPYELHDFFLYYTVRRACAPDKLLRMAVHAFAGAYSRDVILQWLRVFYRRFFSQQFKRSCLPDGAKVGSVSLSPRADWRMPSDAVPALWLAQLDALE